MAQLFNWRAKALPPHRRVAKLEGYQFSISETHTFQARRPSGTAITLQQIVEAASPAPMSRSPRTAGRRQGEHIVTATGPDDVLELRHNAHSEEVLRWALYARRVAGRQIRRLGVREIFDQL